MPEKKSAVREYIQRGTYSGPGLATYRCTNCPPPEKPIRNTFCVCMPGQRCVISSSMLSRARSARNRVALDNLYESTSYDEVRPTGNNGTKIAHCVSSAKALRSLDAWLRFRPVPWMLTTSGSLGSVYEAFFGSGL